MTDNIDKAIAVVGPTAAGKTKLAIALAHKYQGEIIGADSRQVYKGMDIGTGKDLDDYYNNGHPVPYHLIDVVEPTENFDVANYQRLARQALNSILAQGHLPIVAGGSGLYLQALIDNYEFSPAKPNTALRQDLEKLSVQELYQKLNNLAPALASKLNNSDRHNHRRLIRYLEIILNKPTNSLPHKNSHSIINWLILGIDYPMEILEQRIYDRLIERLENEAMIEEVYRLHEQGVDWRRLESFGLEYRFISRYLREQLDYDQMVEQLYIAIRQFAKRQKTWFKRWEKQGREIHWLDVNNPLQEAESLIDNFL